MKKYNITMLGETIPIVSDEGDAYIDALTAQIEHLLMHLTRKGAPGLSPAAKLLFVSIMLADEVYKKNGELDRVKNEQERAEEDLDNAKLELDKTKSDLDIVKSEYERVKAELARTQRELEEFLNEFDSDNHKSNKQKK